MAYITYNKLWESELNNNVSKRDKLKDLNNNQLKLEVHIKHKKDEETTTNFEASNPENVINIAYLDDKLLKINGQISLLEKD